MCQFVKTSEKIKQLILDPELGKLAADLAGTSGVRLYHDHAMVKQPWANPTNFHVDNPYDPFYSRQAIMFWIALDATTVQNGCLYFLPGTHKTSGFEVGGSLGETGVGELFREYPAWAAIEPYAAEMKARSGCIHQRDGRACGGTEYDNASSSCICHALYAGGCEIQWQEKRVA